MDENERINAEAQAQEDRGDRMMPDDQFMKVIDPVTGKVTDPGRDLTFPNGEPPSDAPRCQDTTPKPEINNFVRVVGGLKVEVYTGAQWITVTHGMSSAEADRVALAIKSMAMLYGRRVSGYVTSIPRMQWVPRLRGDPQ